MCSRLLGDCDKIQSNASILLKRRQTRWPYVFTFILRFQLVKCPVSSFYEEIYWLKVISHRLESICLDTNRQKFKCSELCEWIVTASHAKILLESLSRRRFCQHGRQPEVSRAVIDDEWWRQPFSFEINNASHSAFTFVISNENGWRHHSPSITTRFTSGWRPCWQKRRLLKPKSRELKEATFLSTRTSAGSKSRRYRWRVMASAVLVWNQQRQSFSFHVRDFKREQLTPSFAIYNDAVYFRLTSVSKSRYYKERNVQSKKRKAIRRWFVSFVMGAMFLASALNRGIHPPEILKNITNTGGKCFCLGHWLTTWRPWRIMTNADESPTNRLTLFPIYLSLFIVSTRVKTHKLVQVCKQVVTSLFTSCQQVVFALLVPSLL